MVREVGNYSRYQELVIKFEDLLHGQFPITEMQASALLKCPSDFANLLNVHVNHLNRVLHAVRGKTTTKAINQVFHMESKRLLTHTHWPISKISENLGFHEACHFSAFFRKHEGMTPTMFRLKVASW